MRFSSERLRLYAVTDRSWLGKDTLLGQVDKALAGGATLVQLREKDISEDDFLTEAKEMVGLCHSYGVPLIINDNVDIAMKSGADGVHVGQDDMSAAEVRKLIGPDMILGVTAKTVDQALRAQADGADYIGSGAVFGTSTKPNAKPMSADTLRSITRSVDIPVVAIGGINRNNACELNDTGISGIAAVSGIFAAEDISGECRKLLAISDRVCGRIRRPSALSIAGSDSGGGAGIQADIKTMTANGVYAMTAITALTAQNTMGVTGVLEADPGFLASQLDAVFTDIRPDAVKTGMVSSAALIDVIADKLIQYSARNIVVDPVMIATSGSRLIASDAVNTLMNRLLPIADVVTPNIPEAEVISEMSIASGGDMECAAQAICAKCGCAVLIKGGHQTNTANDYLWDGTSGRWFEGRRIDNPNTHGTGCTLSSAIASNLAKGFGIAEAVERAKAYISACLEAMLDMGNGSGPLDHAAGLHSEFTGGI